MMFNSIEKELQRFNNQRKYNNLVDENKKIKIFYPPSPEKLYQTKSKLSQINEELQEKTKTILYFKRYARKSSHGSSDFSDHTVSKKGTSQITQTLSPIQFSKYLNRKSEVHEKKENQVENNLVLNVSDSPYKELKDHRIQKTMSFAPLPTEQSVEDVKTEAHVFEERTAIQKVGEKELQKQQYFELTKPIETKNVSPIQKLLEKGQMLSYVLIIIGIILILVQIIK